MNDNETGEHKLIDTLQTSENVPKNLVKDKTVPGHGLSLEIVLDAQNNDPVLQTINPLMITTRMGLNL